MFSRVKSMLRRVDRGTRFGPAEPPWPTHETMLVEHLRRQEAERRRRCDWERRF